MSKNDVSDKKIEITQKFEAARENLISGLLDAITDAKMAQNITELNSVGHFLEDIQTDLIVNIDNFFDAWVRREE
jgi:hypothetical protein